MCKIAQFLLPTKKTNAYDAVKHVKMHRWQSIACLWGCNGCNSDNNTPWLSRYILQTTGYNINGWICGCLCCNPILTNNSLSPMPNPSTNHILYTTTNPIPSQR